MTTFDFMEQFRMFAALAKVYPPRWASVAQLRLVRPIAELR
jgi:hypothetical protein